MEAVLSQGPMSDPFDGGLSVEIGCTAHSGLRLNETASHTAYIDPFERIVPLAPDLARLHGGHFCRWGFLKAGPVETDGQFHDELGVTWATGAQGAFPVEHPLSEATAREIGRHPFPSPPSLLQVADDPALHRLLDAPIPGIVGTALALAGAWRFLEILAEDAALASALLDWTESCARQHYTDLLDRLPRQPDLIVIQDVFGTEQAPFFSEGEFRRIVLPRLSALIDHIRSLTKAPLCLQLRGAALPFLPSLAGLGVEVLGIDHRARGVTVAQVRSAMGSGVVLHGTADLVSLGRCISAGDMRGIALLACELAEAVPAIAAPADPMSAADLGCAARGAAFLAAFNPEELRDLGRLGPVRPTIERAARQALEATVPPSPSGMPTGLGSSPSRLPALLTSAPI